MLLDAETRRSCSVTFTVWLVWLGELCNMCRPQRGRKLPSLQRFRIHFQEGCLSFGFVVIGINWQPVMPCWTHAPQWLQNFLKDQLHSSPLSLSSIMVILNLSKNIRKFWCECSPEITELHKLLQKSLKSEFITTGSVTFPPLPFASLVITFSILSYFRHHSNILPFLLVQNCILYILRD